MLMADIATTNILPIGQADLSNQKDKCYISF